MYINNDNLCIHRHITQSKIYIADIKKQKSFVSSFKLKITDIIDIHICEFKAFSSYKTFDLYIVYSETDLIVGIGGIEKHKKFPYPNISSIGIDEKWTKKGIGTEIYKKLINHYGGLCSDCSLTKASLKVWKKIQKHFKIEAAKFDDELKYIKVNKIDSLVSAKMSNIFLIANKVGKL